MISDWGNEEGIELRNASDSVLEGDLMEYPQVMLIQGGDLQRMDLKV
jgi:hypothetical protein